MPKFMDVHDHLTLPETAIKEMSQSTRQGARDQFGVRQIELYYNADGKAFCLLEGPNDEAIRQHHAALEVPCGEVYPVESLL